MFWQLHCVLMLNWIVWNRTICIKMDLALNSLQGLICHKTQQTKPSQTNNAERLGWSNSAVVPENTRKLHKLILAGRKLKLCERAEELKVSESCIFIILHEHSSMRKLCSKWVLCLLNVYLKQQCVDESKCCLQLFQRNKNKFLRKYVTMDKT